MYGPPFDDIQRVRVNIPKVHCSQCSEANPDPKLNRTQGAEHSQNNEPSELWMDPQYSVTSLRVKCQDSLKETQLSLITIEQLRLMQSKVHTNKKNYKL